MNKKVIYGIIAAIVIIALVVIIVLVNGKNSNKENNTQESVETVDNSAEEKLIEAELYSSDKQIVFMQPDDIYWVFGYEENKISSYTIYVRCENEERAKAIAPTYTNTDMDVKNVTTIGRYVKVEMDSTKYETLTPDELRGIFPYLRERTK